jgi:hypothetical protein
MVAIRTNLLVTPSLLRVSDASKGGRAINAGNRLNFFTRHKHFVDDICTYGSFENIYAGLQLCMVAVRTNLFATRGYQRAC